MLASLIDGDERRQRHRRRRRERACGASTARRATTANRNGSNLSTVLSVMELCWGDVGLLLSMPARASATRRSHRSPTRSSSTRYDGRWAAMAITEPEAGSDSAAIRTTAVLDGDEYVLNGEKIYVTSGERADLVVVWATLDRSKGRAAIKSFVVERDNPGPEARAPRAQARHPRVRHRRLSPGGLPRAQGGHARQRRDRRQAGLRRRDADLRQHPAAGRGRWRWA